MAAYNLFPRFPFVFIDNNMDKVWTMTSEWGNNLIAELESNDSDVLKRKVEIDGNGSIEVTGRINVADVDATISATAGDIRFNSTSSKFQGFDGTSWQDFH